MLAMLYPRNGFEKGRFDKYSRAYVQIFRPGRLTTGTYRGAEICVLLRSSRGHVLQMLEWALFVRNSYPSVEPWMVLVWLPRL